MPLFIKMDLAPIVLFVYNRPSHTKQLLDSLSKNAEAQHSILHVFCDGAKENTNDVGLRNILEVRDIVKIEKRFREVKIKMNDQNKGLANSIIQGVTQIVNEYGKVIVLEDDLIVSTYFLSYMNDSLVRYENNNKVGQIGACNFFACGPKYPNFFFIPIPDSWGWGTWKNRWDKFNPDAVELLLLLENDKNALNIFNAYGSYDFLTMLKQQIANQVSSWAIRWQAVCVLNKWLTLYPNPSVTHHIESKDATHANVNITPPLAENSFNFGTTLVEEIPKVIKAMKSGYAGNSDYCGKIKREYIVRRCKKTAKEIVKYMINYRVNRCL